jgi:hypothetical protein
MILRNQMPYYTISLHLFLNFGYTPEHHCHGNQNDNHPHAQLCHPHAQLYHPHPHPHPQTATAFTTVPPIIRIH